MITTKALANGCLTFLLPSTTRRHVAFILSVLQQKDIVLTKREISYPFVFQLRMWSFLNNTILTSLNVISHSLKFLFDLILDYYFFSSLLLSRLHDLNSYLFYLNNEYAKDHLQLLYIRALFIHR